MSRPRHLLRAWPRLQARLRRAKRRALFTDFDGTLTCIRSTPHEARLSAAMRRTLQAACAASTVAGVISGRQLEDVEALVGLRGVWYVGAHGYFLRSPVGRRISLATPAMRRAMVRLARRLQRNLRGLAGIVVEPKRATVAVHYRGAGSQARRRAQTVVENSMTNGLRILSGKKVWEFVPGPGHKVADKWAAIQLILRQKGVRASDHACVAYLGDDATDEQVFERLRGITVAVGKRRRTAARYYLQSPAEVREFLERWKELGT